MGLSSPEQPFVSCMVPSNNHLNKMGLPNLSLLSGATRVEGATSTKVHFRVEIYIYCPKEQLCGGRGYTAPPSPANRVQPRPRHCSCLASLPAANFSVQTTLCPGRVATALPVPPEAHDSAWPSFLPSCCSPARGRAPRGWHCGFVWFFCKSTIKTQ